MLAYYFFKSIIKIYRNIFFKSFNVTGVLNYKIKKRYKKIRFEITKVLTRGHLPVVIRYYRFGSFGGRIITVK